MLEISFFVSLPYYMYPTLTVQHLKKNWAGQVELCPTQDENQLLVFPHCCMDTYFILLALLQTPYTLIAQMAAQIVELTWVKQSSLQVGLQLMTFPLRLLQLQWRVVFCYPGGTMLRDCAPSLPCSAMVANSLVASSVGLASWALGSVP